jgi:hypothetical protein
MNHYTTDDLEALARGRPVPPDVFQAIVADRQALTEITRRLQVRELLEDLREEEGPANLARMDVTLAELALFFEGKLEDGPRLAAVLRFLQEQYPDAMPDPHGEAGTRLELTPAEDTRVELHERKEP